MFTGIIESVCKVVTFSGSIVVVDLGELVKEVKLGDSVAVNGVCLTAAKIEGKNVSFDVSGESLGRSIIGKLKSGDMVNIELAMRADGRFGGHIVQGHVDGIATVKEIVRGAKFWEIKFTADEKVIDQMVEKGSVAINGISLTVADIDGMVFKIAVIPVTIDGTMLKNLKVGDHVNIETDIIGKMIHKQIARMTGGSGLTIEKLRGMGY